MHELSLASALLDQLLALVEEHRARRVLLVAVTIGPFSGVVAESFAFGFNTLKTSYEATREARLELTTPGPVYRCLDCGKEVAVPAAEAVDRLEILLADLVPRRCPRCGANRLSPRGGGELLLNHVEME
ncbi:MAG: hydrogenase maturation nickel metallochaperone HypA [Desulfobulbus sp.]|jgi:hydrogenase nickel incorporation protein HypA/HybF